MLRVWKCNLKNLSRKDYEILRDMCYASKNVYNTSIYNIRQNFFHQGEFLRYEANYHLMVGTKIYDYLGAVAQQSMKAADASFKSFFASLKLFKRGKLDRCPNLPRYLHKNSMFKLVFDYPTAQQNHICQGYYNLPMSRYLSDKYSGYKVRISIPSYIQDKRIRQIHIIPKYNGRYFEARYLFDDNQLCCKKLDSTKALSIDLGISNFATCVTSEGKSFIIDGKKVKSINQWYNKENARLQSVKDKQKIKGCTKKQYLIANKRERRIQNFIYDSAKYIVNYCIDNQIGNIVVGYNDGFQDKVDLGKVNNQQFVMLPYGKFKSRLKYLCKLYGINYQVQEESYTSKASFWDKDEMPKWNPDNPKHRHFSGKRIKRGLYQTRSGDFLNADVNGALNILRKSNVVSCEALYSRGAVDVPKRIRLA